MNSSLYEGFGLPILESMSCGCPVITCLNSSILEIAQKAAYYVKDHDLTGMIHALCDIQKPQIRQALIQAGFSQVTQFSWSKMADTIKTASIEAIKYLKS